MRVFLLDHRESSSASSRDWTDAKAEERNDKKWKKFTREYKRDLLFLSCVEEHGALR